MCELIIGRLMGFVYVMLNFEGRNYGLGGDDGVLMIDFVNLKSFSMNEILWYVSVGVGYWLGEMDKKMYVVGKCVMVYGICLSVGIGGYVIIVRVLLYSLIRRMCCIEFNYRVVWV